ncbi:hypothetical protein BJ742DRAFT_802718 [Cladochytrium replicatum]|nr:hypothetical protein BJ742DRAFT_802718 [Cladochytrium replicatum]
MGDSANSKAYDNIWLVDPVPKMPGKFRLIDMGMGWQERKDPSKEGTPTRVKIEATELKSISWMRVARDYGIRIVKKDGTILRFDGFPLDSFRELSAFINQHYKLKLNQREISVRGLNWGTTELHNNHLSFLVGSRPAFDIPLSQVLNANTTNKDSDVNIELRDPFTSEERQQLSTAKRRGADDMLVQIQFYIPGLASKDEDEDVEVDENGVPTNGETKKNDKEDGEIGEDDEMVDADGKAVTAASHFCDLIKRAADLGATTSEIITTFDKVMCLAPRGRFQVHFHPTAMRMGGKSYEYPIPYNTIFKLFLLPKPDAQHHFLVMALQPALRQGNTIYKFLVFQFQTDEETEDLELNIDDATYEEKYKGKLEKTYDGATFQVFADIVQGMTGQKYVTSESSYTGSQQGIQCYLSATEVVLYPLEKSFIAIWKPTINFKHSEVERVTFSRLGTTTRMVEVTFTLKTDVEYVFRSFPRNEYEHLESFCRSKKIQVVKEADDVAPTYNEGDDSDDGKGEIKRKREDDEDDEDESEDEDFVASDESASGGSDSEGEEDGK